MVPVLSVPGVRHMYPPAAITFFPLQYKLVEIGETFDKFKHLFSHLDVRHMDVCRLASEVL